MELDLTDRAQRLAERLVAPLGRRWLHVRAVAVAAGDMADVVCGGKDREVLISAAWLHDIGYSPAIGYTQFHPLDGARYLRDQGWDSEIVSLVAHHSGSQYEAEQRGLAAELAEFPLPDELLLDALVTADLTTGPSGERLSYDERIAEILKRYPEEDPVHQAWLTAGPILAGSVRRTEDRLAAGSA